MNTDVRDLMADYLAVRRALGYKLVDSERILAAFAGYPARGRPSCSAPPSAMLTPGSS